MDVSVHPSARLAMDAVWHYVLHGKPLPCPLDIDCELKKKRSAFVSIKHGETLRGCIGSLHPTRDTLAEEIIHYASHAASSDPRFQPVRPEELAALTISVDVLSPLQPASGLEDWDTRRLGLAVLTKKKQGVLLPDLPGISRSRDQLRLCLKKAGLRPHEPYEMFHFSSRRYRMPPLETALQ